jgi:hypothetical protein
VVTILFTPESKSAKIIQTKILWRGGAKTVSTSTMTVSWGGGEVDEEAALPPSHPPTHDDVAPAVGSVADAHHHHDDHRQTHNASGHKDNNDKHQHHGESDAKTSSSASTAQRRGSKGLWTPDVDPRDCGQPQRRHSKAEDKRMRIVVNEGDIGNNVGVSPKNQVLVFDMSGS